MAVLSQGNSPVVESTWQRRHSSKIAKQAVMSTSVSLFLIGIIYIDMCYGTFSIYFEVAHPILWYIELFLVVLFIGKVFLNLLDVLSYLRKNVFGNVVELSLQQKTLLGVKENEKGFRTPPKKSPSFRSPENSLIFSLNSSVSQASFSSEGSHHSSPTNFTSYGYYSPNVSHSHSSYNVSPSASFDRVTNVSSGNVSIVGGRPDISEISSLRARHVQPLARSSPVSSYERITDLHTLSQYLQEQEEKEYRSLQASPDNLGSGSPSFWNYGSSPMDCTYVLKKYQYQVATRSPQSPTAKNSHSDQSVASGYEEVWSRFGVIEDNLYLWTERLRKWLSLTVVSRLANEIEELNKALARIGCEDTEIGEISVSTLKQLALTKGPYVPSLNIVIPYLDFSSNQEYLVRRIKELGTGCMSEFSWKGGGYYGKPWGEHLPTDTAIVMHLVCSYLDSRLPAQPKYPDGKTFTSQYFLKTPDKPNLERKDAMCLYQTSINPPHFQVVIGKEIYNLPPYHGECTQQQRHPLCHTLSALHKQFFFWLQVDACLGLNHP